MIFSKVDVLPASQSKSPRAAMLHGGVAGGGEDDNVAADRFECSVRTDCSFLLLHANFACQRVFGIRSKASFHMHFIDAPGVA